MHALDPHGARVYAVSRVTLIGLLGVLCILAGAGIAAAGLASGVFPVGSLGGILFGFGLAAVVCCASGRHG